MIFQLNRYHVLVDGNRLVFSSCNKKACISKMLSLFHDGKTLVEVWYVHNNGYRNLVDYRNKHD